MSLRLLSPLWNKPLADGSLWVILDLGSFEVGEGTPFPIYATREFCFIEP